MFFRDPFRLVPVQEIAEISDKLTRNEIATPNEIRSVIGWKPADDKNADQLRNRNISQSAEDIAAQNGQLPPEGSPDQESQQSGVQEFVNNM
jgi:hypothetical protein